MSHGKRYTSVRAFGDSVEMQNHIDPNLDISPVVASIDALYADCERASLLVAMRADVKSLRVHAGEYVAALDQFYGQVSRAGMDVESTSHAAEAASKWDQAARERLHPKIEKFKEKEASLHVHDDDVQRLISDIILLAELCIQRTTDLHGKLLALAVERRAAADKIRHARPISGEIDYTELSREHMARYPKIRARLAE